MNTHDVDVPTSPEVTVQWVRTHCSPRCYAIPVGENIDHAVEYRTVPQSDSVTQRNRNFLKAYTEAFCESASSRRGLSLLGEEGEEAGLLVDCLRGNDGGGYRDGRIVRVSLDNPLHLP